MSRGCKNDDDHPGQVRRRSEVIMTASIIHLGNSKLGQMSKSIFAAAKGLNIVAIAYKSPSCQWAEKACCAVTW